MMLDARTRRAAACCALALSVCFPVSGASVQAGPGPDSETGRASASPLTPSEVVARAPMDDWHAVPPEDILVMDLASGSRVVIELAPEFAPVHVANIRALARAGWFDGTTVNRVQDNYVAQWGGATGHKPLPPEIATQPPAEYERPRAGAGFVAVPYRDAYAPQIGHADAWPAASDGSVVWLTHCYATVGVGRDVNPDTGTGAELYAVIGHAPRHLDRNIAVVGRVLSGIEALSTLPRGGEAMGFYARPEQEVGIRSIRLASDLPPADRPAFQVLRQGSPSFTAWIQAKANRRDAFFLRPAGAVDICNLQPPVRAAP